MQHHVTAFSPASKIQITWWQYKHLIEGSNLNVVNISTPEFKIWQHIEVHWNNTSLQHIANILSVPLDDLYKQVITSNTPVNIFLSTDESTGETVSVLTLFSHARVYVMAMGLLIPAGLGILCCCFFWCQPARLVCQPLQSGSMQHTVVDDNVEAAPIYRCDGKAGQPIVRPQKNHDLHIEWEPTQTESQQKQKISSRAVPTSGSLDNTKIQGMQ